MLDIHQEFECHGLPPICPSLAIAKEDSYDFAEQMKILHHQDEAISSSYIDGLLKVKDNEELILERPRSRGLIECEKCKQMLPKKMFPDHMMAHEFEEDKQEEEEVK